MNGSRASAPIVFATRAGAAWLLADKLAVYRGKNPLVLAIPRGAVEMGRIIAQQLNGELDVVLVRKLRAPGDAEFAIGAVDETGWTYIAPHAEGMGADPRYIEAQRRAQLEVLRKRRTQYTPQHAPVDARGRIAIVVDDGLVTGATMIAALHATRARQAAQVVCAVPVGTAGGVERVRACADRVVCLQALEAFHKVSQVNCGFRHVEDSEVVSLLADVEPRRASAA